MSKPAFVYVTYIRATAEKVWDALFKPEFTRQVWFGAVHECEWTKGAPWTLKFEDGRVADTGEILEIDRPRRIVIKWRSEWKQELKDEGWSRCTIEIEPATEAAVKLTITHEAGPKLTEGVSGGWPKIVANIKSLLETGAVALERK